MLVSGETSGGADGTGAYGGIYLEFGIDPGYAVDFSKNWLARFHLPFALGLILDNHYEVAAATGLTEKTFGFADLGFVVDVPLRFVPARYGNWTFSGGLHLLWLGDHHDLLADPPSANAFNGLSVTGGNGFEVWAVAGVKVEY